MEEDGREFRIYCGKRLLAGGTVESVKDIGGDWTTLLHVLLRVEDSEVPGLLAGTSYALQYKPGKSWTYQWRAKSKRGRPTPTFLEVKCPGCLEFYDFGLDHSGMCSDCFALAPWK